jgi:folate-binding protein YgfZ
MLKNLIKTGSIDLDTYEVLKLNGDIDKVEALLQGQVTSDISELANNNAQMSCLLDHKGFIQADFILARLNNEIFIVVEKSLTGNLKDQLSQFTKFYKVEVKLLDVKVKGLVLSSNEINNTESFVYFKGDEYILSIDISNLENGKKESKIDLLEWKVANKILLNYLFVESDIDKYRPNELNYDKSRVSFSKGCFRGQEVVARVHYLGVNRREFVTAVVPGRVAIDTKLKIHGETLKFLDHKIFTTHIKRDDFQNDIYKSIEFIRYPDSS